jgi:hypothetical protein
VRLFWRLCSDLPLRKCKQRSSVRKLLRKCRCNLFIGVLQVWLVMLCLQPRLSIERGHRNVVLAVCRRHVYALLRLQLLFFVSFGRDVELGRIFMLQPLSDRLFL